METKYVINYLTFTKVSDKKIENPSNREGF